MSRQPTLKRLHTGDTALDRVFDALYETLRPVLLNPLFGAADFRWSEVAGTAGAAPSFALQYRKPGTSTWSTILSLLATGGLSPTGPVSPSTPAGGAQEGAIYQGAGVPSNSNGNNGDAYFRTDTPAVANQRLYMKSAGVWTGVV